MVQNYNQKKHGTLDQPKRIINCIKLLKKGDVFEPRNLTTSILSDSKNENKQSKRGTPWTVTETIKLCREIGILDAE